MRQECYVEFCHSVRNGSKINRKMKNRNNKQINLMATMCLNTRFLGSTYNAMCTKVHLN